ncbi:MAG TPA: GGDEF domain-containing protein [Ectothiorhodospiraceae bacterium]|nr:GGDEF domain-containing protein [Ectothiorhodospiraceae bacterium]
MSMVTKDNTIRGATIAFAIIIVILLTTTLSGLYRIHDVMGQFDQVVDTNNRQTNIMHQIMNLGQERSLILQSMLFTQNPFEWEGMQTEMNHIVGASILLHEQLLKLPSSPEELKLLELQQHQTTLTSVSQNKVANLIYDQHDEEAQQLLYEEAIPNQRTAINLMKRYTALQSRQNLDKQKTTREQVESFKEMMVLLLIIGLAVSITIAINVVMRLMKEIKRRNLIESELEERVAKRTQQLSFLATHDALTSLPNRTLFLEQLAQSIKQSHRHNNFTAIFFMDLDGFKQVNDQYGHDAGDKVLIEISRRIDKTIREEDLFSRIGGDEFTLILNNLSDQEAALPIADKIIAAVNRPIKFEDLVLNIGISIGISFYPNDGEETDQLITLADDAMYQAKHAGKNHYVTVSAIPRQ